MLAADAPGWWQWRGRPVRVVDGATVALPDTQENQAEYPQSGTQKPGLGFPLCRLVGLLCLREDRGDRTLQWAGAAGEGFFRDFDAVVIAGPTSRAALARFRKAAGRDRTRYSRFAGRDAEALMDRVLADAEGEPVVVGLGNIVGWGERLVRHWSDKGIVHDP